MLNKVMIIGNLGRDPELVGDEAEVDQAFVELYQYSHALQTERRDKPAQDIVTTLLNSTIEGDKLSEIEFDMFFLLLAVAGNETTRNAISHGMKLLTEHPDQRTLWFDNFEQHTRTAVDEIVRYALERGGTCTGEHGVGIEKLNSMCVQFTAQEREQMFAVKRAFDPLGLLNPGKVIPTLQRCAEYGRMVVRGGVLPHPELERF